MPVKTKQQPPADWPSSRRTSTPARMTDKITVHVQGFYTRYVAVGLPVPEPVTAALIALRTAISWDQPDVPLDQMRHQWRTDLTAAAKAGDTMPDPALVIDATMRAGVLAGLDHDLRVVAQGLDDDAVRQVRRNLDPMLGHVTAAHDAEAATLRELSNELPVAIRSADRALRAGHGDAWLAAVTAADRLAKLRDMRERITLVDHVRDAQVYAGWRHPERLPARRTDVDPTVRMLDVVLDEWDAQPWSPSRDQLKARVEQAQAEAHKSRSRPRGDVTLGIR